MVNTVVEFVKVDAENFLIFERNNKLVIAQFQRRNFLKEYSRLPTENVLKRTIKDPFNAADKTRSNVEEGSSSKIIITTNMASFTVRECANVSGVIAGNLTGILSWWDTLQIFGAENVYLRAGDTSTALLTNVKGTIHVSTIDKTKVTLSGNPSEVRIFCRHSSNVKMQGKNPVPVNVRVDDSANVTYIGDVASLKLLVQSTATAQIEGVCVKDAHLSVFDNAKVTVGSILGATRCRTNPTATLNVLENS